MRPPKNKETEGPNQKNFNKKIRLIVNMQGAQITERKFG